MKIAIVFCTWKRVYRLNDILDDLVKQTFKNFDVFIWNNNHNEIFNINEVVKKYELNIRIKHSEINVGGIGRFYYSKEICEDYDKIIFIDDDQTLGEDVVCRMVDNHIDDSILSWWGWSVKNNYFNRVRVINFKEVDYCGTGGMIVDPKIFKHIDLKTIPKKYEFIEDLWLSFVAKYDFNYKLIGGDFNIKINNDGNDQFNKLIQLKIEFYDFLNKKYNINK
jgi:hypothetical protein